MLRAVLHLMKHPVCWWSCHLQQFSQPSFCRQAAAAVHQPIGEMSWADGSVFPPRIPPVTPSTGHGNISLSPLWPFMVYFWKFTNRCAFFGEIVSVPKSMWPKSLLSDSTKHPSCSDRSIQDSDNASLQSSSSLAFGLCFLLCMLLLTSYLWLPKHMGFSLGSHNT